MDVMSLTARLALDSSAYESGLKNASGGLTGLGNKIQRVFKGAAVASGAIIAAGATAVSALTKSAVSAYAEYEQLVGGVETLFGGGAQSIEEYANNAANSMYKMGQKGEDVKKLQEELIRAGYDLGDAGADGIYGPKTKAAFEAYAKAGGQMVKDAFENSGKAADTVMENAWNAFETAGLSANDYMATVTGFSASLLQSLGGDTEKAAAYADMAVIDMADNANKMGTDMASIQNAYQGFAKQNYTMLDNLKLGYGGTKQEMQRLLTDAEKLTGKKYDLSNYADIVEAIHAIQTEMGITGTTAEEASNTIEGSTKAMKASWTNLLTAFGQGKDVRKAMKNFTKSAKNVIKNTVPVIKNALVGIGEFLTEIGPVLVAELPGLVESLLPGLLTATGSLIGSLAKALPGILGAVGSAIKTAVNSLGDWLREQSPILGAAFDLITGAFNGAFNGIASYWNDTVKPKLDEIAAYFTGDSGILTQIADAIESATSEDGSIDWSKLFAGLADIDITGMITGLFAGVPAKITEMLSDGAAYLEGGAFAGLKEALFGIIEKAFAAPGTSLSKIATAIGGLFTAENFANAITISADFGSMVIDAIGAAITGIGTGATALISAIGTAINNAIGSLTSDEFKASLDIAADKIIGGLVKALASLGDAGTRIAAALRIAISTALRPENMEGLFGEGGTIRTFASRIIQGIVDGIGAVVNGAQNIGAEIIGLINDIDWTQAGQLATETLTGLIDQLFSGLSETDFEGLASTIGSLLGSALAAATDAASGIALALGKWILSGQMFVTLGTAAGIVVSTLWNGIKSAVEQFFDSSVIVGKIMEWMDKADEAIFGRKFKTTIEPEFDFQTPEGGTKGLSTKINTLWEDVRKAIAEGSNKEKVEGMIAEGLSELTDIDYAELIKQGFLSVDTAGMSGDINVMDLIAQGLFEGQEVSTGTEGYFDQLIQQAFGETPATPEIQLDPQFTITQSAEQQASDAFNQLVETLGIGEEVSNEMSSSLTGTDMSGLVQNIGLAGQHGGQQAADAIGQEIESRQFMLNLRANVTGLPGGANSNEKFAKGMSGGRILHGATVFGMNDRGQSLIGGEAGPEAVVGVRSLDMMIQGSVNSAMRPILKRLDKLVSGQGRGSGSPRVYLDGRELSQRMAENMNKALGGVNEWKRSGHA